MGFVEKMVESMKQAASTKEETPVQNETKEVTELQESGMNENATHTSENETSSTGEKLYNEEEVKKLIDDNKKTWEQEKLNTLSKDEQIQQLKDELLKRDLQDKVMKRLKEEQLPLGISDFIKYSDEAQTLKHLEDVIKTTKSLVDEGIKMRLRGKTPEGIGHSFNTVNDQSDPFTKAFSNAMNK